MKELALQETGNWKKKAVLAVLGLTALNWVSPHAQSALLLALYQFAQINAAIEASLIEYALAAHLSFPVM